MKGWITAFTLALAGCWLLAGCKPKEEAPTAKAAVEAPAVTQAEQPKQEETPPEEPKSVETKTAGEPEEPKPRNPTVEIDTTKGKIVAEVYPDAAPKTVANFLALVKEGYYDGLPWHRVASGFVIQTGLGPEKPTIPDEVNEHKHRPGALAMAKPGSRTDPTRLSEPDSASTQFYITLCERDKARHLNDEFTVFGQVTEGMDVAGKITQQDKVTKIRVLEGNG
jgi:peptidyl-prolyl cis-trans isomerase B (cyclophilin B)